MRVNINIPALDVKITNAEGNTVGSYSMRDYKIEADVAGLIAAGQQIKQELERALATEAVTEALEAARTASRQ